MEFITRALPRRKGAMRLLGSLIALAPLSAFAAEGDHVKLAFNNDNKILLLVSALFGVLALVYAYVLSRSVMAAKPGPESMQSVGKAIKDGALAYLKKQVTMMAAFGAVLFVALFALYFSAGAGVALGVAGSFLLGATGSYAAGYAGMIMAVNGNMRVAFAALTSYKQSLEVAFRSGAISGLVTVGIGLVGASAILLLGGESAVKYLIGFGFGGSLAALFMRVGGGIFTKAADVGADLVGKVEQGIPEDDPRNPAVIADNVGDNVGDCAGMAADVFESYEVTLISAIVLAAATSAVLDRDIWIKLVVFSLLAAGLGIFASSIGISLVKGTDDMSQDPLVPIRRGFLTSAILSLGLTAVAAFILLGGKDAIQTTQLTSPRQFELDEARFFQAKRIELANVPIAIDKVKDAVAEKAKELNRPVSEISSFDLYGDKAKIPAPIQGIPQAVVTQSLIKYQLLQAQEIKGKELNKAPASITLDDLLKDPTKVPAPVSALTRDTLELALADKFPKIEPYQITAADLLQQADVKKKDYVLADEQRIASLLEQKPELLPEVPTYAGFRRVTDPKDPSVPELQYAVPKPFDAGSPPTGSQFTTIGEMYLGTGDDALVVKQIRVKANIPGRAGPAGTPATPPQKVDQVQWIPPISKKKIDKQIQEQRKLIADQKMDATIEELQTFPVSVFVGPNGKVVLGVPDAVKNPQVLRFTDNYFALAVPDLEKLQKINAPGLSSTPPPQPVDLVVVRSQSVEWWKFVLSFAVGLLLALGIEKLTGYYVSTTAKPVNEVAGVSSGGAAPMIIQGFAYGAESSAMMVVAIIAALMCPLALFPISVYGGYELALFGVAMVGLGMLSTTGYVLAMDTFGPISDNAQGVFEMSGAGENSPQGARVVSLLDAAGNTTKALTKGFAIATAVVAAIALFNSYRTEAMLTKVGLKLDVPEIFMGLLIGGAAPFLFSAFAMNAVGRSAFQLIKEVRRQFREMPGIMDRTQQPDYARCVAIVTAAAQRELVGPAVLAIALPVAVGFGFSIGKSPTFVDGQSYNLMGAQALGGFLAGAILSGQLLAVLLSNSGGMWDNAKKIIEDGKFGGKNSENHKASVICDTVGDPFKDTAGPALNPLIKVMNLVALLMAGVVILPLSNAILITVTVCAIALLVWAIRRSKQGSMADDLNNLSSE